MRPLTDALPCAGVGRRANSADGALERYARLRLRLETPRGCGDLVEDEGEWRAAGCERCFSPLEFRDDLCPGCGAARRLHRGAVPRGLVQSAPRPSSRGEPLAALADLSSAIASAGRWPLRVWWLYVVEMPDEPLEAVAAECRRRWPRHARKWNRDYCGALVRSARARVGQALSP